MAKFKTLLIETIEGLRAVANQWDALWQRSDATLPTGRAELIAQWLEQFGGARPFVAIAINDGGRLVAALPLLRQKIKGCLGIASLPRNDWCWAGDLLLDPEASDNVLETLFAQICQLRYPLLWFDGVPYEAHRWQRFLAAGKFAGLDHCIQERFRMGTVELASDLNFDRGAYQTAWSGNHRRHMRKALRRANARGGVLLDIRRPSTATEVELLLREGFDVEHRSWKGRGGSSVMMNPAMWSFYLRQATQLAAYGALELFFLRHEGRAIAFEYGWRSKGIYFTPKVGFDEDFSELSPGQLLRYLLLEQAFLRQSPKTVDFLGPLCDATAKWCTSSYPIGRVALHTGKPSGRALIWGLKNAWQRFSHAARRKAHPFPILEIRQPAALPCSLATDESKIRQSSEERDLKKRRPKTPIDAS